MHQEALIDSKEGIEALMDFARAGHFVMNEYHEKIAEKYGVPTEGVVFARSIPAGLVNDQGDTPENSRPFRDVLRRLDRGR